MKQKSRIEGERIWAHERTASADEGVPDLGLERPPMASAGRAGKEGTRKK